MATMTYTGTLTIIECARCHMDFGVLPRFQKDRRADHGTFYCPAGHHNFYPQESDEARLKRQLDERDEQLTRERQRRDQAEADARHQEARVRGYQGALGKAKKRAAKGVCPAPGCKRSFVDVARHVSTCHPDLAAVEA